MTSTSIERPRRDTAVELRPLEREDRPALVTAAARLSGRTLYLRFASPKPRLTERDLDWVTAVEHHAHEALLAIDPGTRRWIGVARYAELLDEPGVVDVAVIIDDAFQGRGLGSVLLARLIARAREQGHHTARASVLAENVRALALVRRMGFRSRASAGIVRELQLDLVDWTAPAASGRPDDPRLWRLNP
jgi:RimJ/RimL family protein N-acetyltransferase